MLSANAGSSGLPLWETRLLLSDVTAAASCSLTLQMPLMLTFLFSLLRSCRPPPVLFVVWQVSHSLVTAGADGMIAWNDIFKRKCCAVWSHTAGLKTVSCSGFTLQFYCFLVGVRVKVFSWVGKGSGAGSGIKNLLPKSAIQTYVCECMHWYAVDFIPGFESDSEIQCLYPPKPTQLSNLLYTAVAVVTHGSKTAQTDTHT